MKIGWNFGKPSKASIAIIEEIPIPFLQIDQLIANKKAIGRGKDQVDVMELEISFA